MNRTKIMACIVLLGLGLSVTACDSEKIELQKSPCAGIEGSPCGPKRPVNGALNPLSHDQA